jgi:site-specific recombinase XerD
MDFAVILQLIKYNPIKPIKVERDKPKEPEYLTVQELELISNADFEADPAMRPIAKRLDRIRDILIILTCTGVHWADYLLLDESNLYIDQEGDLIYCANRQKTDNTAMNVINVPLAKKIIEKYGGSSKLPKMSNQKFNDYIKVLFAHLKINKYGSAKIGRKSLADYHTNEDPKPDGVIMKMMGLGDARSLDHYRRVDKRALKKLLKPV